MRDNDLSPVLFLKKEEDMMKEAKPFVNIGHFLVFYIIKKVHLIH